MIDLNPYLEMIPTGNEALDTALNAYLTLIDQYQTEQVYDEAEMNAARQALIEAAGNAELDEAQQLLIDQLLEETSEIEPPDEKGPDESGTKPI
jgi:hypothetical protein